MSQVPFPFMINKLLLTHFKGRLSAVNSRAFILLNDIFRWQVFKMHLNVSLKSFTSSLLCASLFKSALRDSVWSLLDLSCSFQVIFFWFCFPRKGWEHVMKTAEFISLFSHSYSPCLHVTSELDVFIFSLNSWPSWLSSAFHCRPCSPVFLNL